MVICSAYGCKNRSDRNEPGTSFHRKILYLNYVWFQLVTRLYHVHEPSMVFPSKLLLIGNVAVTTRKSELFQVSKESKMPRRCCIPGCKSNYDITHRKTNDNTPRFVSIFRFPRDQDLQTMWVKAINRQNWTPSRSSVVCIKHFREKDVVSTMIMQNPDGSLREVSKPRAQLEPTAVPCLFLNQTPCQNPPKRQKEPEPALGKLPEEYVELLNSCQNVEIEFEPTNEPVSKKNKPFKCEVCHKSFFKVSKKNNHVDLHFGKENGLVRCINCTKSFSNKRDYLLHYKSHFEPSKPGKTKPKNNKKPRKQLPNETSFTCPYCSVIFPTKWSLEDHELIHTGRDIYACTICRKLYHKKSDLDKHMSIHILENPFQCSVCSKGFSKKSLLDDHRSIHDGKMLLECWICSETFAHEKLLTRHFLTHLNEKRYTCSVCKVSWKDRIEEHEHFDCIFCLKVFALSRDLNEHLVSHHLEQGEELWRASDEKRDGLDSDERFFSERHILEPEEEPEDHCAGGLDGGLPT